MTIMTEDRAAAGPYRRILSNYLKRGHCQSLPCSSGIHIGKLGHRDVSFHIFPRELLLTFRTATHCPLVQPPSTACRGFYFADASSPSYIPVLNHVRENIPVFEMVQVLQLQAPEMLEPGLENWYTTWHGRTSML